jgi:hypothetical protein
MIGAWDLAGQPRIQGPRVDMGAYEAAYIPSGTIPPAWPSVCSDAHDKRTLALLHPSPILPLLCGDVVAIMVLFLDENG